MDLSPREMTQLADACGLDLDGIPDYSLAAAPAREFLELVGPCLGGPHVLRHLDHEESYKPNSARAYVYMLLGLDEGAPFEQALVCAARVACTAPGMVKVHNDSPLADFYEPEDADRYGYGFYCCPSCTPKDMLLTDVGCTHGQPRPLLCHVCGTDAGRTRCLWIHPQHLETAINPSTNRDCSESDL